MLQFYMLSARPGDSTGDLTVNTKLALTANRSFAVAQLSDFNLKTHLVLWTFLL